MADYSIPETLDYLLSSNYWNHLYSHIISITNHSQFYLHSSLNYILTHINYQSTHTNSYQTHYFQTIITTTNISIITFFQSFTHIIHYPFIKSNITIKHYQFCVTHTVASQRNDIHFIHATIRIPKYAIPH